MTVQIESRVLPGIGVCQQIELHDGRRLGIITRRNGQRDLVLYDEEGEAAAHSVTLDAPEADAVAELLGAPQLLSRMGELQALAAELQVEQLPVPAGSPFDGRPLGETRARTRTGASIVAVLRQGTTHASPGPDFTLRGGDLAVAVGTRDGMDRLGRILAGGGEPPGRG